jgi:hypothetical protein
MSSRNRFENAIIGFEFDPPPSIDPTINAPKLRGKDADRPVRRLPRRSRPDGGFP